MSRILPLLAVGSLAVVGILLVARLMAPASPAPTPTPPPIRATAQPQLQPSETPEASRQALDTGIHFINAYLGYDWHNRTTDPAGALRPLVTDRMYASFQAGVNPDGSRVPWASVRPDLHEVDTVTILGHTSQMNGTGATMQAQVREDLRTDAGANVVNKELDLELESVGGIWRVGWVSAR